MAKLRLLLRTSTSDYDGKCVGYHYKTVVIDVPGIEPEIIYCKKLFPEVVGGEWLEDGEEVK
jgi:hypothetical protein